jgi:hypothetical protein
MHKNKFAFTYLQCPIFGNKYRSIASLWLARTITVHLCSWANNYSGDNGFSRQCISAPRFQASVRFNL